MRITGIRCKDFLSFGTEGVELDSDRHLTVVVGPNGAGKSNVVRALELVRTVMTKIGNPTSYFPSPEANPEDIELATFARSGRHRGIARSAEIAVDVVLTTSRERAMITSFVRSAVASALRELLQPDPMGMLQLGGWVDQQLTPKLMEDLFSGTITISGPSHDLGSWSVVYVFESDGVAYGWVLSAGTEVNRLRRIQSAGATTQMPMVERFGAEGVRLNSKPPAMPHDLSRLADLLPGDGEYALMAIEQLAGYLDNVAPFRSFVDLLQIDLMRSANVTFGLGRVFWSILAEGLVLTSNFRLPPRTSYPLADIERHPNLSDGSLVPLALYRLKNGDQRQRKDFDQIQSLFSEIIGGNEQLEVSAGTIPNSQAGHTDDQIGSASSADKNLNIRVLVAHNGYELPIDLAGHGIWEACVLATLIAGSRDRVLVLDEPATSLHPTVQRRLPGVLRPALGQVLLITHSPYLIPSGTAEDLDSIIRIVNESGSSEVRGFDPPVPASNKPGIDERKAGEHVDKLIQKMISSAEARALLFSNGVVLVEGDTELNILPVWMKQSAIRQHLVTPHDANISFFNVGGDHGFETSVHFIGSFSIPWVVLGDGKMFKPSMAGNHIFRQIKRALGDSASTELKEAVKNVTDATTYQTYKQLAEQFGVFTVATGWEADNESIEAFMKATDLVKYDQLAKEYAKSKSRLGRHFAESVECPPALDPMFATIYRHLGIAAQGRT